MRIQIKKCEVKIYLEDEDYEKSVLVGMAQRRGVHVNDTGRFLLYSVPPDRELLYAALRTLLGPNRGRFMFERVMEKIGEIN